MIHSRWLFYTAQTTVYGCNDKHYQELYEAGKPGKVALVAVMRKLVSMANSVMHWQSCWQENYQNFL